MEFILWYVIKFQCDTILLIEPMPSKCIFAVSLNSLRITGEALISGKINKNPSRTVAMVEYDESFAFFLGCSPDSNCSVILSLSGAVAQSS